ncbi:unnamed protein product [Meloidogyne enterolobii]|uniref:Uncharacterized protein n=1 Tax=Meloidogyne enterolobii TaxID=390850 RepID=A0ACB0XVV7_MELEN
MRIIIIYLFFKVQKRLRVEKVPTFADILIASATTSNNVSWRNSATGTWFIQTLCEVFSKRAKTDDILKMLTYVKSEVAKKESNSGGKYKQVPETLSTLCKHFFFFPGVTNKEI